MDKHDAIVQLLREGRPRRTICEALHVSSKTVSAVAAELSKTEVPKTADAMVSEKETKPMGTVLETKPIATMQTPLTEYAVLAYPEGTCVHGNKECHYCEKSWIRTSIPRELEVLRAKCEQMAQETKAADKSHKELRDALHNLHDSSQRAIEQLNRQLQEASDRQAALEFSLSAYENMSGAQELVGEALSTLPMLIRLRICCKLLNIPEGHQTTQEYGLKQRLMDWLEAN